MNVLYYECHITVEPVFEERLELFTKLCAKYYFKPAKLLMKKRKEDTAERSQYDTFCTGRSQWGENLQTDMHLLVKDLTDNGFKVWRYKIEACILDVRLKEI